MKRTVSLKLETTPEQFEQLDSLQAAFADACNLAVPLAVNAKISNRIKLHHAAYYAIREAVPSLGSQMVCKALHQVAKAYKTLLANRPKLRKKDWPTIRFHSHSSVHFDKRTYSLRGNSLSLFTLDGRTILAFKAGDFQNVYLAQGIPKEAELVRKRKGWFFNLVLDLPDAELRPDGRVLGVDMGENNLAATSSGKLFGGGKLRHERDKFLHLRGRLQSKGTKSAKQLLKKVSGKEARHVKHVNHEVSKAIVAEAVQNGCSSIALEALTNIRKRIKAGKRMRSRLHRWAWAQLQEFVAYKAEAKGVRVVFVNPAYTSQTCAVCGALGNRSKHRFSCPFCGRLAHADLNAGLNIASLGCTAVLPTGAVNHPYVAALTG
jgi:IS605 OrfB family transposase